MLEMLLITLRIKFSLQELALLKSAQGSSTFPISAHNTKENKEFTKSKIKAPEDYSVRISFCVLSRKKTNLFFSPGHQTQVPAPWQWISVAFR